MLITHKPIVMYGLVMINPDTLVPIIMYGLVMINPNPYQYTDTTLHRGWNTLRTLIE